MASFHDFSNNPPFHKIIGRFRLFTSRGEEGGGGGGEEEVEEKMVCRLQQECLANGKTSCKKASLALGFAFQNKLQWILYEAVWFRLATA